MSVRNLRIREDTAKYLRNLDPGSAFYDPKTRSMRKKKTRRSSVAAFSRSVFTLVLLVLLDLFSTISSFSPFLSFLEHLWGFFGLLIELSLGFLTS